MNCPVSCAFGRSAALHDLIQVANNSLRFAVAKEHFAHVRLNADTSIAPNVGAPVTHSANSTAVPEWPIVLRITATRNRMKSRRASHF